MSTQRDIIDYGLRRRAVLVDLACGRRSRAEVCDAHPYLLLAARHYGEPSGASCPVCDGSGHRVVHYVYGDCLGRSAGQAKSSAELALLAAAAAEFTVYVVEVCIDCGWNHLARAFALGCVDHAGAGR